VSSKRCRCSGDCNRSRIGSCPSYQPGIDVSDGLEERFHVDEQVLVHGQALKWLDEDLVAGVFREQLADRPVDAVHPHRVGAAYAVPAGPTKGQ